MIRLRFRISVCFARAVTFAFILNLALSMASEKQKIKKEDAVLQIVFIIACVGYCRQFALVLNYGPRKFLKSRSGSSL